MNHSMKDSGTVKLTVPDNKQTPAQDGVSGHE